MDLQKLVKSLENCPCGKKHSVYTKHVEISGDATEKTGSLLREFGFGERLLLVADENTLAAAEKYGLCAALASAGFDVKRQVYENMLYARVEQVYEVEALAEDVDGIISVGTGSLNDICRVSAFRKKKKFCIFATAPSMDGFASDTAPIIENNFKISWQAEQPDVIIADTRILAAAPAILKAAGYGDMVAKCLGIMEWKMSNILTGEYYCDAIANVTLDALSRILSLTDKIMAEDEEAAGAVAEALVLSGIAMKLAGCSRPASGAEHVVSHYWECYKLARGIYPELHGRKVGVATLILVRAYRNLADSLTAVSAHPDTTNFDEVYTHFSADQIPDVIKLNSPTITDKIDPAHLQASWGEIRELIYKYLPDADELEDMMKRAGCATTLEEIGVSPELAAEGLRYHSYMRYRVLLTRLLPMMNIDIMDYVK
jgi:glycerol-1-phosphate dehydrogenase [NAD(P)+]